MLATRPHSTILIRQTRWLKFSLYNGRPLARSMENLSAQLWKFSWEKLKCCPADSLSLAPLGFLYSTVSHGRLSYGSVVSSTVVCHEASWAAHAALSSGAALLEWHFCTCHLWPARYTYRATGQPFSATAKQKSTGCLKQKKYTGFLLLRTLAPFSPAVSF